MSTVSGRQGIVAAGHPVTAEAGAHMLEDGGNAVDAAVAAACTSFIAEPVLTGAGGGGFMLIHNSTGRNIFYDGFSRMPARPVDDQCLPDFRAIPVDFGDTIQTFHIGQASVATPSLLAMLFAAHKKQGHLPIEVVMQPAIAAARNGVHLNELQASFIHLLEPILTAEAACRRLHTNGDSLLAEGDLFRNPDLANTLEMLSIEGVREMYEGDLARAIVSAVDKGGLLSMDDLRGEQVTLRKPLSSSLFGGILLTNPPPSSGGCLISFAAKLLETLMRRYPEHPFPVLLTEALRETSRRRGNDFDHKVYERDMAEAFLAEERIRHSLEQIRRRLGGEPGTASKEPENRHGSTTHISVVDREGTAVSVTSSNGEGSGIVVPGTGIHLNNMLGEEDINPLGFHKLPAGATLSSMMAPSMLLKNGRPVVTLGSGGSNRLRGAIVQVLCRYTLMEQSIHHAVFAPRLHNEGNRLDVEPGGLNDACRQQLMELGWEVCDWENQSVYFGGVHAICMDEKGRLDGAGDPRRGGSVAWA
ncbi:MAG: gamma-glutamyltransferase [Mariprofundaceae bacterium]|nr:gamma-glutamyltransferase [Mariprofundaceae bacterium]